MLVKARPILYSLPLCSLLVQNTVTALLASNRVSSLERHLAVAVAAKVVDRRTIDGTVLSSTTGLDWGLSWGLVSARHIDFNKSRLWISFAKTETLQMILRGREAVLESFPWV